MGKADDTEKTFLEEVTNESGLKECVGSQQMEPQERHEERKGDRKLENILGD